MFLTPDEVADLTGKKRWSAQIVALATMGIMHGVRPDGRPLVLKEHIGVWMGEIGSRRKLKLLSEPNWEAVNAKA